ncbi:unnamed protein product, partial [Brassica rapa subsp. trilocularis]
LPIECPSRFCNGSSCLLYAFNLINSDANYEIFNCVVSVGSIGNGSFKFCNCYNLLYLAVSPVGKTIVTGGGDATLRFWNVLPSLKYQ